MASLVRLMAYESPRTVALGLATAVAQSLLLVPAALLVKRVFEDITAHDPDGVVEGSLLIMVLYVAAALLGYLSRRLVVGSTTTAAAGLRRQLLAKVGTMSQSWLDRQRSGDLQSLIVTDTERVENVLSDLAYPLFPAALVGVVLAVVALVVNPLMFVVMVAVVVPFMLAGHFLLQRTRSRAVEWRGAAGAFGASTHLLLRAMRLTKIESAEAWEERRREPLVAELARRGRELETARAAHAGVYSAVAAVAGAAVLAIGGSAVARRDMSLGDLLAFYAILALLLRQLQLVGPGAGTAAIGLESLRRIERFLAIEPDEPYSGARAIEFRGAVALEGVSFGYTDAEVLHDVDVSIRPSECVALIGPNGAGKSTLVSLLLGLYRPDAGRALADGVPYDELDMRSLRRRIGVVLQDAIVFPGTIRENIAYGREDATDAEVRSAAAAALAAPFAEALPLGYETPVGDEGVGLSGGQRQRVAIARALIGSPTLLLLDEPTTYLDEAGTSALIASLTTLPQAPTIVLVTHDPEVARHADRAIHLRDGRIHAEPAATGSEPRSGLGS